MKRLKVVVIGAGGTIGHAVAAALGERHEVIAVSRRGALPVDLETPETIDALFDAVPDIDAVVSTAASVQLAPFGNLSDEGLAEALRAKLFGQIALLQRAAARLREGGARSLRGAGRVRAAARPARECGRARLGAGNTGRAWPARAERHACA